MNIPLPTKIEVKSSPIHGLGVFAITPIKKGEIIEECPVITVSYIDATTSNILHRYRFLYPIEKPTEHCIPLGYGCIYNHSDNNNAMWTMNRQKHRVFDFIALRDIQAGEEICTKYGGRQYWEYQATQNSKQSTIFNT